MTRNKRFALAATAEALALMALAACGGGTGSENDSAGPQAVQQAGPSVASASDNANNGAKDSEANSDTRRHALATTSDTSTTTVVVRAQGTLADNGGPLLQLRINGAVVGSTEVRATAYQNYSFTVSPIAAGAKVDVVFNNDLISNGADRNLFVESVTINGTTIASTATGVTFDRGPGNQAFDGQDVLPGLATLWWNGALRFTAPAPTAPNATASLSPACQTLYAANPALTLSSAQTVVAVGTLAKPAKGAAFVEPSFKTCVTRATNHTADGVAGYARTEYSRRQMFNANNTRQLIVSQDGYYYLYDANTHALVKKFPSYGVDPEPQWHPTDPDLLYIAPDSGGEMAQRELNVVTGVSRVIGNFKARLQALFPKATPTQAYTRDEGSPSKDGRYWCYMVRDAVHTTGGNWNSVGVFVWDRDTDTILGSMPLNGELPDHVSMSPSGNYCVVSSTGLIGTTAYSRDFKQKRQLFKTSEHSDLAIDANGDDVYVHVDSTNYGDVFMVNLRTGERTTLMSGIRSAAHFSGKAFNKPGWILMTTQATWADGNPTQWMQNKIMAVQLKANPIVYSLGFHRTNYTGEAAAPTASVNRDFTRIAFNSNWGANSDIDVDTYNIEIPADALKDTGSTAPTQPTQPTQPIPTTPEPPAPPATTFTVSLVGAIKRDAYLVTYTASTNLAAKCASSWVPGQPFAWLYSPLTDSADGLKHDAAIYLDTATGAKTIYLVCKANASGAEKELAIQVK